MLPTADRKIRAYPYVETLWGRRTGPSAPPFAPAPAGGHRTTHKESTP